MNKNKEFILEYGQDLFERIFYNIYGDRSDDDMHVEKEWTDREGANCSGKVYITFITGEELVVEFRDGNWNGSEITDYYI